MTIKVSKCQGCFHIPLAIKGGIRLICAEQPGSWRWMFRELTLRFSWEENTHNKPEKQNMDSPARCTHSGPGFVPVPGVAVFKRRFLNFRGCQNFPRGPQLLKDLRESRPSTSMCTHLKECLLTQMLVVLSQFFKVTYLWPHLQLSPISPFPITLPLHKRKAHCLAVPHTVTALWSGREMSEHQTRGRFKTWVHKAPLATALGLS